MIVRSFQHFLKAEIGLFTTFDVKIFDFNKGMMCLSQESTDPEDVFLLRENQSSHGQILNTSSTLSTRCLCALGPTFLGQRCVFKKMFVAHFDLSDARNCEASSYPLQCRNTKIPS